MCFHGVGQGKPFLVSEESCFSGFLKISTKSRYYFTDRKGNFKLKKMKPLSVRLKKLDHNSIRVGNTSTYKVGDGTKRDRSLCLRVGRNVHIVLHTHVPSSSYSGARWG